MTTTNDDDDDRKSPHLWFWVARPTPTLLDELYAEFRLTDLIVLDRLEGSDWHACYAKRRRSKPLDSKSVGRFLTKKIAGTPKEFTIHKLNHRVVWLPDAFFDLLDRDKPVARQILYAKGRFADPRAIEEYVRNPPPPSEDRPTWEQLAEHAHEIKNDIYKFNKMIHKGKASLAIFTNRMRHVAPMQEVDGDRKTKRIKRK